MTSGYLKPCSRGANNCGLWHVDGIHEGLLVVVPPLDVFNPVKYQQVEKEIKEVLNLA